MTTTQDIVARLWNLCHVLRDDGITYHEYVTELTFLLFLKMSKETETEDQLPPGYRWDDLQRQEGVEQLAFYRALLVHLGNEGSGRVQAIFHDANTALRQPRNLTRLVDSIDALDWYSAKGATGRSCKSQEENGQDATKKRDGKEIVGLGVTTTEGGRAGIHRPDDSLRAAMVQVLIEREGGPCQIHAHRNRPKR